MSMQGGPGGDPRFGPVDDFFAPSSTHASTSGTVAPGTAAVAGGFMAAPPHPRVAAAANTRLGPPRWLAPAIVLAVLGLLACLFVTVLSQRKQGDANAFAFHHTTLSTPPTIVDLTLGVGPGVDSANTRATLALAAAGVIQPISGGYVDADGNAVAFVAAGKRVTKPAQLGSEASAAARAFGTGLGSGSDAAPITLTNFPAGNLGGILQCGPATVSGVGSTYCVAVDAGAVVTVVVAGQDPKSAAATALTLRNAVETRTG